MNVSKKTRINLLCKMNVIEHQARKAEDAGPFAALAAAKELARAQLDFNRAVILAFCADTPQTNGITD
jgi:hypothetical protein